MSDLDSLINDAKTKISDLISKPKMTEKLLSKPPFRFLHDTVSAITTATGFAEGLFDSVELDSANLNEKNAKMSYLDKIFLLVGICKASTLEVKSVKVVQGLEPELTNIFLIALAECAADATIDNAEAVRRCLAGETPGQSPPLRKRSSAPAHAEAKGGADSNSYSKALPNEKDSDSKDTLSIPPAMEQVIASERGKSRGGTRGGKPNQASADTGLSGFGGSMAPNLDKEIERCDGSEATTQQLLGDLITRPKLTEKLLSKPPFRFLHDIMMEIIRVTGFATGLYSEAECDSANVSEKNQKITFLEKIIKVVGIQLNTLVEAKPMKIVAGLDPQITNNFLQLLAVAAKHMPDSTNAVRTALEQLSDSAPQIDQAAPQAAPKPTPIQQPIVTESSEKSEEKRPRPTPAPAPVVTAAPSYAAEAKEYVPPPKLESFGDDKMDPSADGDTDKRSTRPTTARRRPPKVKEGVSEVQAKDVAPVATKKAAGIIVDGQDDDDIDELLAPEETRLVDEIQAGAKSTSDSAANPQSKLLQNIMSRQAEQEAAVRPVDAKAEVVDESKAADGGSGGGIRLSKLRKVGSEKKVSGSSTSTVASTFADGDFDKMRAAIQALVQQTGPLGTCLDFIQEDISLMTAELRKWEDESRRYEIEYEEAKRKTKESLRPLKTELAELEDQINEQMTQISALKASNTKNEDKIQQTLKMIATA